jgi:hypothetical protein
MLMPMACQEFAFGTGEGDIEEKKKERRLLFKMKFETNKNLVWSTQRKSTGGKAKSRLGK